MEENKYISLVHIKKNAGPELGQKSVNLISIFLN